MVRRFTLILGAVALALAALAPAAFASDPFDRPAPDAELVSRTTASGVEVAQAAMSTVRGVRVTREQTVVTVDDGSGSPRPITVDYSDFTTDPRAATAGYLAGAYVGLGVVGRFARILRSLFGPLAG